VVRRAWSEAVALKSCCRSCWRSCWAVWWQLAGGHERKGHSPALRLDPRRPRLSSSSRPRRTPHGLTPRSLSNRVLPPANTRHSLPPSSVPPARRVLLPLHPRPPHASCRPESFLQVPILLHLRRRPCLPSRWVRSPTFHPLEKHPFLTSSCDLDLSSLYPSRPSQKPQRRVQRTTHTPQSSTPFDALHLPSGTHLSPTPPLPPPTLSCRTNLSTNSSLKLVKQQEAQRGEEQSKNCLPPLPHPVELAVVLNEE
jgi:hypothetical protein